MKHRLGGPLSTEKGHRNRGGAPRGNKNRAQGPRIGRAERAVAPLPSPAPTTTTKVLPQRRRRAKTGGRDFAQGQNSHTGEIFRRGPADIPVTPTSMLKLVAYLEREQRLKRLRAIYHTGTNREVTALEELMGDRIEGMPLKKVAIAQVPPATWLIQTKDGDVPLPLGPGATLAAHEPVVFAGQVLEAPGQVR